MMRVTFVLIASAACTLIACSGNPVQPDPPPVQTDPLRISCPAAIERESVSGQPLTITYDSPTVTGGRAPVTVSCAPLSGAEFSVGTTNVLCQATDSVPVTMACSFNVVVKGTPRLSLTDFLAFGDSLTAGIVAPDFFTMTLVAPQSYPFNLQRLLQDRYRAQAITVENDGEPGEQAFDAAQRRFASAMRVHSPEVVLLMEGTNDLFFWREEAFSRAIPALESMVLQAHGIGAKVFLATIPPQRPGGLRDAVSKLIPAFNNEIRAIVARHVTVTLVDVEAAILKDMSFIGNDDLHLTERGYVAVAQTFFDSIRQTLEVQAPVAARRH